MKSNAILRIVRLGRASTQTRAINPAGLREEFAPVLSYP
jgi:hypothetical protein